MSFTVVDGSWVSLAKADAATLAAAHVYVVLTEIAKSGRAKCRICGEMIEKGIPRIGVPIKWRGGEHGYISSWKHPGCVRIENDEVLRKKIAAAPAQWIYGFDALNKEQQALVEREVTSTTIPEHMKPIDPNDASFTVSAVHPEAEQPPNMRLALLPFQREGYGWMLMQERSAMRGGILADQMGMGKTIQTIALLVAQKTGFAPPALKGVAVPSAPQRTDAAKTKKGAAAKAAKAKAAAKFATSESESSESEWSSAFEVPPVSKKKAKKKAVKLSGKAAMKAARATTETGSLRASSASAAAPAAPAVATVVAAATSTTTPPTTSGPTLIVCPSSAMMQWVRGLNYYRYIHFPRIRLTI